MNDDRRLELQAKLETILGNRRVFFQPPPSVKLSYPCIIYERDKGKALSADDILYKYTKSYTVKVIDKNPDSVISDIILKSFQYCSFDRHYEADNLHHYVLNIYY